MGVGLLGKRRAGRQEALLEEEALRTCFSGLRTRGRSQVQLEVGPHAIWLMLSVTLSLISASDPSSGEAPDRKASSEALWHCIYQDWADRMVQMTKVLVTRHDNFDPQITYGKSKLNARLSSDCHTCAMSQTTHAPRHIMND